MIITFTFSCKSQQGSIVQLSTPFIEILSNSDKSINELSAKSKDNDLNLKLNAAFQSLSENNNVLNTNPKERLKKKIELFTLCKESLDNCSYTPEGYTIIQNEKFLNIKYQYNQFSSYDTYYKYALVNLTDGTRLIYSDIFSKPETVLKLYNQKYIETYTSYLSKYDLNTDDEEELNEYEIIKNHLDNRDFFKLEDLNNLELIYESSINKFTEIRFHYNGSGGVYRSVLSNDFISFKLEDLNELISPYFTHLLNK